MKVYLVVGYTKKDEYNETITVLKACINDDIAYKWRRFYLYSLKNPYNFHSYGVGD